MTRAPGVMFVLLVGLLVASAPATAEKAKKPAATKQAEPAKKKPADKQVAPAEDESAEQADADVPLTKEEIEQSLPAHINGPKLVDVGSNIEVDVPDGMYLLERAEARKLLEEGGDSGENVLGAIGSYSGNWGVIIEFADIGYVSDKDANELDPADLMKQFQQGNIEQNVRRDKMGIAKLFLDGWSEMPKYDALKHHLVWGLKAHSDNGPVINFFTRILGREGFMSVNLIDDPATIEQSKQDTAGLLAAIRFRTGYRYEDHAEGDKSSGIGLKALVLGGAGIAVVKVAKTGFLITLLLALKKGFIVVIAAIAGFFKWLFGRGKKTDDFTPPDPDPTSSEPPATPPEA